MANLTIYLQLDFDFQIFILFYTFNIIFFYFSNKIKKKNKIIITKN